MELWRWGDCLNHEDGYGRSLTLNTGTGTFGIVNPTCPGLWCLCTQGGPRCSLCRAPEFEMTRSLWVIAKAKDKNISDHCSVLTMCQTQCLTWSHLILPVALTGKNCYLEFLTQAWLTWELNPMPGCRPAYFQGIMNNSEQGPQPPDQALAESCLSSTEGVLVLGFGW